MLITKSKAAKGRAYPLKSSALERALVEASISHEVSLSYGHSGKLFEAYFWIPNPNVPYERFYIRVSSVASGSCHEARELMENSVIPEFVSWANAILCLPLNSPRRMETQMFVRDFSPAPPNHSIHSTVPLRGPACDVDR